MNEVAERVALTNLRLLTWQYLSRDNLRGASGLLDAAESDDTRLEKVLRDPESPARENIDELMRFYGLLEVSCLAGFVPPGLTSELCERILRHLSVPILREYCLQHSSALLLDLLRARVLGEHQYVDQAQSRPELFMEFIDLWSLIESSEHLRDFGKALDGRTSAQFSTTDLIDAMSSPEQLGEHIAQIPQKQSLMDSALMGYMEFIKVAGRLRNHLAGYRGATLFRSASWHSLHSWFVVRRDRLSDFVDAANSKLAAWEPQDAEGIDEAALGREQLETTKADIQFLLGGSLGAWLNKLHYDLSVVRMRTPHVARKTDSKKLSSIREAFAEFAAGSLRNVPIGVVMELTAKERANLIQELTSEFMKARRGPTKEFARLGVSLEEWLINAAASRAREILSHQRDLVDAEILKWQLVEYSGTPEYTRGILATRRSVGELSKHHRDLLWMAAREYSVDQIVDRMGLGPEGALKVRRTLNQARKRLRLLLSHQGVEIEQRSVDLLVRLLSEGSEPR